MSHTSHPAYPSHLLDTTRWLYHEPTGLLTNKVYADGMGTSYSYTPDDKLSQRTWARLSPATGLPLQTLYSYDATHSLAGIAYSDGTPAVTFAYDRLGRQLSAITAGVSTNLYAYDALTLALANETVIAFGETNVLSRATDSLGRPAGLSVAGLGEAGPGPYAVAYGYDEYGRFHSVSSLVSSVLSVANYSYLPGSHLLASVSNNLGLVSARTYEPHRDLIAAVSNTWGGTLVSAFDYTNDALGRRTARADSGSAFASTQANAFGYNARSEVASAAMRNGTSSYEFDPIGNRTEATLPEEPQPLVYLSNPLNQYTNIVADGVASVPIHDADGNLLVGPAGPDRATLAMVWDGENRLVAVTNGNTLVVSDYDYRSRRTRKRVYAFADDAWSLSADHRYLYDRWNLIRETIHNQQSTITNSFVWGLDLSGSLQGAGGIGGLLSLHSSPLPLGEGQGEGGAIAPYFPTFDANGNISEYLATNGVVAAHYEYDAFGRTISQSGDLAAAFAHRFSTKYLDLEIGLYYYGYRYYSPELGRWVSRDPIGERGGGHQLAFCVNAAVDWIDSLGLQIPSKDCSTDIYFGHSGDSWNPTGEETWGKCQKVAYGVCWGDRANNRVPIGVLIPGIPEQPGLVPADGLDPDTPMTKEQIATVARYYSKFYCAGLRQLEACCKAMEPDASGKLDKDGKPVMQRCCSKCTLNIFHDKDPKFKDRKITRRNVEVVRSRLDLIPGLREEIKNSCYDLTRRSIKEFWGDGLPNFGHGENNPITKVIKCDTTL